MAERLIQLSAFDAPADGGSLLRYSLALDGRVVAANRVLTAEESARIREIPETYETLFVNGAPQSAQLALGQIQGIGATLFDLWLKSDWQTIAIAPGDRRILVVASALPEVLNLPWELLRPPGGSDIGSDAGWGVRRLPWPDRTPVSGSPLLPGPLRVLFFACSPRDLPELDFEREEEVLMTAVGPNAVMETASLGTFEELGDLVDAFNPHIVHLSGHGVVGEQGASFYFEDERGFSAPRSAATLGQRFSGTGVRCVFVSGCQAGAAPPRNVLGGVCQSIIAQGIPMAIGWAAAIIDETATTIAKKFYQIVAGGAPTDHALARARWDGKENYGKSGDPSWSLPVLYATTADTRILDKDAPRKRPSPSREQLALPGMGAGGYARHLVGRRRELQAVIPRLRDGSIRGVVLTGLGGVGKSSLATRLARKLEASSARLLPIAITSIANRPVTPEAVLRACRTGFLASDNPEAAARTNDKQVGVADRLSVLVNDLSDGYVLVLDNFDNSLDEATRSIVDPDIAEFYRNLLTKLIGSSRVLVTSRYLPADLDPLPDDIVELTLAEFSETAYLKFMFREARVRKRYQAGAAEREVLSGVYQRFGAAPSLLARIRTALRESVIDPAVLGRQIKQSARTPDQPLTMPLSTLAETHTRFCSDIFVERLYGRLPDTCRRILACLSVYPEAFGLADAAALTGAAEQEVQDVLTACHRSALMHPAEPVADATASARWSTYGSLRRWLMVPPRLPLDDGRSVHRVVGDFLVKLSDQSQNDGSSTSRLRQLLHARAHYLAAGAAEQAREATYRISSILIQPGEYAEIERLNTELIDDAQSAGEKPHPDPATWIARTYLERAEYQKARDWYEKALTFAGDEHPREKAHGLQGLATISIREGNNGEARRQFADALKIQQDIGDRQGQGVTWHQLASIDLGEKKYGEARTKFQTALGLLKNESPGDEQAIWHQLGSIDLEQNELDAAMTAFDKARDMARQMGDRKAEADAVHQIGRARFRAGARQQGVDLLKAALETRRAIDDRAGEAVSFRRLSEVAGDAGDHDLALRLAVVAYTIDSAIQAKTKPDLDQMQQCSDALGYSVQQVESLKVEIKEQYLADRAKTLLKRLRARP
jgi:tetratricopeptide (TPR) repeat protein